MKPEPLTNLQLGPDDLFGELILPDVVLGDLAPTQEAFFGTDVLRELLKDALAANGLLDETKMKPGSAGPLGRSFYFFRSTNFRTATQIIIAQLKRFHFHNFSRVYRWDESEHVFRCIFPKRGNMEDVENFTARALDALLSNHDNHTAALKRLTDASSNETGNP